MNISALFFEGWDIIVPHCYSSTISFSLKEWGHINNINFFPFLIAIVFPNEGISIPHFKATGISENIDRIA